MKKTVFRIFCVFFALCLLSGCGKLQVERKDPHGSDSLRVMSFNVCGWNYKNVKHLAAKTILAYDADLVGLQECGYACYKGLMQDLEGYSFVGVGRENGRLDKNSGEIEILLDLEKRRTVKLKELIPDWWGTERFMTE